MFKIQETFIIGKNDFQCMCHLHDTCHNTIHVSYLVIHNLSLLNNKKNRKCVNVQYWYSIFTIAFVNSKNEIIPRILYNLIKCMI